MLSLYHIIIYVMSRYYHIHYHIVMSIYTYIYIYTYHVINDILFKTNPNA